LIASSAGRNADALFLSEGRTLEGYIIDYNVAVSARFVTRHVRRETITQKYFRIRSTTEFRARELGPDQPCGNGLQPAGELHRKAVVVVLSCNYRTLAVVGMTNFEPSESDH
jgi:hypothetical protein